MRFLKFLLVLTYLLSVSYSVFGQTPGLIYKPASTAFGRSILDPNGDGFISLTTAGFSGTDYGANSELRMIPLPILQGEPHSDLTTGANGGHTDIVSALVSGNPSRESSYILYKTVGGVAYVIIRMRIGKASTSPKGYSFLLNTDGSFNTGSSGTNPGYDKEIVLQTGNPAEVVVYAHTTSSTTRIAGYPAAEYSQRAVALSTINGDLDYFYDFFIPFSALGITNNPVGITAVTVTSAGSGIEGTISDFNGVDDRLYAGNRNAIMSALISTFPAIPITQLTEDFDYETSWLPATSPPTVNDGLTTSSTSITGTSTEANGTVITVYKNGTQLGSTVTVTNNAWTLSGVSGLLVGDLITAKALASGKTLSGVSNTVAVAAVQPCSLNSPSITARDNGQRRLSGTAPANSTVTIYRINSDGSITLAGIDDTQGTNPTTANSTGAWGPISKFGTNNTDFTNTSYVANATLNGCTSDYSLISAGGSSVTTTAPQVMTTTIVASTSATNVVIRNKHSSNANLYFYVNGQLRGTSNNIASEAESTFSYTGFIIGDTVYARAIGTATNSTLSSLSNIVTVTAPAQQQTQAPTITGTYTAGSGKTITGTSLEAPGTTITVYKNGTLIGTITVSAYGTWQLTGQTLATNDVLTAYAKATGKSISSVSNSVTVQASAPTAPTVTGSYTVGNTSISGSNGNTLVRVYVDGSLVGTATPSSGNWTLSGIAATELYRGAVIHATNIVNGIESPISNTATVTGVASFTITRENGDPLGTIVSGDVLPIKILAKDGTNGSGNNFTAFTNVVTLSAELPVIQGGGTTTNFTSGQLGGNSDKNISLGGAGSAKKVVVVNPDDPSAFGESTITVIEALWRGRSEGELNDPLLNKAHDQTGNWTHNRVPVRGARVKFADDVQQDMVLEAEYDWESVDMNNTSNHGKNIVLKDHNLTVQSITNRGNSVVKTTGTGKLKTNLSPGETFEFPIANTTNNFLSVKNNSSQAEEYAVRVFDEMLIDGYSGNNVSGARVGRTWDISKISNNTTTSVDLTFNWADNQKVDYLENSSYKLYHWVSGQGWIVENPTPSSNSNGVTTFTNYTGTFSPFGIGDGVSGALPVELIYFNSSCEENNLVLNWATASEHDNLQFIVLTSEDGLNWKENGTVAGAGNSTEKIDYHYVILEKRGIQYIKLIQVDIDWKSTEYGPYLSSCHDQGIEFEVFPNPANESINIQVENNDTKTTAKIRLIDMNGSEILQGNVDFLRGVNNYRLELSKDLKGVFFVEFIENKTIHRKKIIVI